MVRGWGQAAHGLGVGQVVHSPGSMAGSSWSVGQDRWSKEVG